MRKTKPAPPPPDPAAARAPGHGSGSAPRLDDLRLLVGLAGAASFIEAARALDLPKQTFSRRLSDLEGALGVRLVERTTRAFRFTTAGASLAEQAKLLVRQGESLFEEIAGVGTRVTGELRVTSDPLFGEIFLPEIIERFVGAFPEVRLEVMLTQRSVDLIEERFDLAFRVGQLPDSTLVAARVGGADLRYAASPEYLARAAAPKRPQDLAGHACIALAPEGGPLRWAFAKGRSGRKVIAWQPIHSVLRVNSLALARLAALKGLGIANLPAFACAEDLRAGRLVTVLDNYRVEFGGVYVVYPSRRQPSATLRAFVDLALSMLRADQRLRVV